MPEIHIQLSYDCQILKVCGKKDTKYKMLWTEVHTTEGRATPLLGQVRDFEDVCPRASQTVPFTP